MRYIYEGNSMSALFNHTIVASINRHIAADFYRDILEADDAPSWGPFTNLALAGGVMLQFAEPPVEIQMQHYAFLVDDAHFDRSIQYLDADNLNYWADPQMTKLYATNTEHGGRGVYFKDPSGHGLELITRPYF